ncbi:MAG: 30S ribosomal protein S20 [Flavobacteriales bacterium]|jgi:small subunit ribosomal protein S20|nr:30S ribosomal protein S20 [Flavobacteriales bacterium]|tara:strand:- start:3589 stop:3843 length:255 start_codon:yes stop_codon:yes gene_type:complete
MANSASAKKRIRQAEKKRVSNKYYHKTMRNAIRDINSLEDKKAAEDALPKVVSLIDRVSKRNIIHKNKAANLKSSVAKNVALIK